jgi:hypothetical protein
MIDDRARQSPRVRRTRAVVQALSRRRPRRAKEEERQAAAKPVKGAAKKGQGRKPKDDRQGSLLE